MHRRWQHRGPSGPLSHRGHSIFCSSRTQSAFPVSNTFVPEKWSVVVSGADVLLLRDSVAANRILLFAAVSSLLFAVGLIMTARAVRTNAQLTTMRSDFVSAVTHELKTPIATIKAAAETLAKDRLSGMSVNACGRIVVMESNRLVRLVENLLAYARITDVSDSYTFQTVEVAAIFNDIQQDFEARLDQQGFELHVAISPGAYAVSGDRFALRMLFGNLLDRDQVFGRSTCGLTRAHRPESKSSSTSKTRSGHHADESRLHSSGPRRDWWWQRSGPAIASRIAGSTVISASSVG